MFAKSKVSQSLIDAVSNIVETSPVKIPTPTGTRVLGGSYGNSAKAHKDQTKKDIDKLKGPKDSEMKEELKGNQDKIDANHNGKIDAQDFQILRNKKKVKEDYSFAARLLAHAKLVEEVEEEINEVLSKDASAGDWIHDFIHSDNPKFAGKSKAERKKMALGAYYGKKNEGYEGSEEDKEEDKKEAKKHGMTHAEWEKSEADKKQDKKKMKEEVEADSEITTDTLKGREAGGKANAFKSFKLRVKGDHTPKEPEVEKPEHTAARASIHAESFEDEHGIPGSPKKNQDVSDKSYLKDMGKKPTIKSDLKNFKNFLTGKKETNEEKSNKKPDWLLAAELKAEKKEGKLKKEEVESIEEKNWIAGAIKHPGALTKKAKAAGETNSEYEQKHKHDSGKTGKQARLALTLKKLNKEEVVDEAKGLSPGQDDAPFDAPYTTNKPTNVKDKSGAVHTPMSRARDLARQAMKKVKNEMLGKAPANNG